MNGLIQARNLMRASEQGLPERRQAVDAFVCAWRSEIREHFDDEERLLLPLCSRPALRVQLIDEHRVLRTLAERCERQPDEIAADKGLVQRAGQLLNDHIRWEERVFFEALQADQPAGLAELLEAAGHIHVQRPGSRPRHRIEDVSRSSTEATTTLAIIGGGAGTRMGGPKHRLLIGERPILAVVAEHIGWRGPTLFVSGGPDECPAGQDRVDRVVTDRVPGEGPLRGMLTALEQCHTPAMVAVPVDMPALYGVHVRWLLDRAAELSCAFLFLRRKSVGRWRLEPFPMFSLRSASPIIEGQLYAGERSIKSLAELPVSRIVDAPDHWGEAVWANLNTPDQASAHGAMFSTWPGYSSGSIP